MLRLANICSLTEFRHNSKDFILKMKQSNSPLVLTVNGKADVVVYDADAFQDLLDKITDLEEEVDLLKGKIERLEEAPAVGGSKAEPKAASKKKG
jgi:PHD/YefM family antitoxin component YafN of YafNO toxin-antitoxin module